MLTATLFALMTTMPQDEARTVPLLTVAEASGYARTSTYDDVLRFLERLDALPQAKRLHRSVFGRSEEGRELPLVIASLGKSGDAELRASGRLRVLVNANIHAGEVEGKEAVQMILREIASGKHAELLARLELLFVPIYNADGNERIDPHHRVDQNGPDGGVGTRENAHGLDLNRDFVKLEAAETRALVSLYRRFDPQVFMDLHTTDGSYHGYHLTYSPSLSTNVDPELDRFERERFLPEVQRAMLAGHGHHVFDYGNFTDDEGVESAERRWITYDPRPRFGTNAYGLRNRISVLSEAYSHLSFEERVAVTRAFVLEVLAAAAKHADEIASLCAKADARALAGDPSVQFGWESALAPAVEGEILVGGVERVELPGDLGTRLVAKPEFEAVRMPVQLAFESKQRTALPFAWALPEPDERVVERLALHGLDARRLEEPLTAKVERFEPSAVQRAEKEFQGHHELALQGEWKSAELELPAGTLLVPARQPLGRLAAQLLEPRSEDSLSTWNLFESQTRVASDSEPGRYPVLRLVEAIELPRAR